MTVDVLIRGDGAVGRTLALALSRQGLRVGLTAALPGRSEPRAADVRAYALNAASQALLTDLKVWGSLAPAACTPVYDMQVAGDATPGALQFSAYQARVRELTHIVDASELDAQLDAALRFAPHVQRVEAEVPHRLLALCEGRDAPSLAQHGIQVSRQPYGHSAVAARLVSDRPHQGRAWQWFRPGGEVLALLPMDRPEPGSSYALVWSQAAADAGRRVQLAPAELAAELNEVVANQAGMMSVEGEVKSWPLTLLKAHPLVRQGLVLLGDCAHQVHPLAGQGLNLGLADVAALARVLSQREPWRELGDAKLLRRYERARALDTWLMGELTDSLWHGFAHAAPAARVLRNQGMALVERLGPVKRWLSQRAMGQ